MKHPIGPVPHRTSPFLNVKEDLECFIWEIFDLAFMQDLSDAASVKNRLGSDSF